MPIKFRIETRTVEVMTPKGEPVSYVLEYRWDPLTSRLSIVCPNLRDKWIGFYSVSDKDWMKKTVEKSREKCPFCKPMLDKIAAKFAPQQAEGGIMKFGDVRVFPNLYPRTDFEAVVTSPDIHYLDLDGFTSKMLADFLNASLECIRKAHKNDDKLLYPVIGCNYMPSAGASLVHPHFQISVQQVPFHRTGALADFSAHYKAAEGSDFWSDLARCNSEREINHGEGVYWYVPFAPTGFCEVRAVTGKPDMLALETQDVKAVAGGLANVLRYYKDHGFTAFNFVIYSNRLDAGGNVLPVGLDIVARPNLRENYTSIDSWYMPLLLEQTIVPESPEDVAKEIRKYF